METIKFEDLQLSAEVQKAIAEMGFEESTQIQGMAIPEVLKGLDIIGQAQTGTGKTVAFGAPVVDKVSASLRDTQALVLAPTRELAIQISEELQKLAKFKQGIVVFPIYGGQAIERQIKALRQGVHVVIGTPGRILDHLDRGSLRLNNLKMVVLDEADEMLNMGFRDDIESILKATPSERQTVFFSATMARDVLGLAQRYLKNPKTIQVAHKEVTVPNIEQRFLEVSERNKMEVLSRLLDVYNPNLSLVFCNTKMKVNTVVSELQARGYFADGLHGDMKQTDRNVVMEKFKKGIIEVLVATDVASRGIDVDDVEAVFNYDIPLDEESYVHRIGRTGRAGKSGRSFTFVVGRENYQLRDIERYTRSKMVLHPIPSLSDVEEKRFKVILDTVQKTIQEGGLNKYIEAIQSFLTEDSSHMEVTAALLKMAFGKENTTEIQENPRSYGNNSSYRGSESRYSGGRNGGDRGRGGNNYGSSYSSGGNYGGGYKRRDRDESNSGNNVKLHLNLGKFQGIRPSDIVGAIAGESGISGRDIGSIKIFDNHSFVDVPSHDSNKVLESMKNKSIRGKAVSIEIATPSRNSY